MEQIKEQRYVVQASQQDCYYFYPYTTDVALIEKNKDKAWRDCFIADFGRISSVIIQDPTDFKTLDDTLIYEGDHIVFDNDEFTEVCEIVKKDGTFYGLYEDEHETKNYVLMTDDFTYAFEQDEYTDYDDWGDDGCYCCPCCGCTCYEDDFEDDDDEADYDD